MLRQKRTRGNSVKVDKEKEKENYIYNKIKIQSVCVCPSAISPVGTYKVWPLMLLLL